VSSPLDRSERVVVLAPSARDAPLTVGLLARAGIEAVVACGADELCRLLVEGAGAALVAEEALTPAAVRRLSDVLERQEPWSDLPIVVFAGPGATIQARRPTLETLAPLGNLTLLERPVQVIALVSATRAALRQRRRQYAARDLVERLAESLRTREQFLATLGHELRNPLAAVTTATELLAHPEADARRARDIIARQARKLTRLVDDLLEVSRVSSGKITLQRVATDLREVVESSVAVVEPAAERAGIRIDVELPRERIVVDGDPVRLEQIAGNLLTNAIKYTLRGGEVRVTVERSGGFAALRVRDTGVGIASAMLEQVFEPFTQIQTSMDRSQGGLGLGLSLVRGLAALHGGRASASSEGEGRGSTFVVELPLSTARDAAVARREETPPAARRRVLVVEDNEDARESMLLLLGQLGHEVLGAVDGPDGVRRALEERPDLVFVDVGLPGFDGYEVARRVRAALGRGPVLVALTGYGQPQDQERAVEAGFDLHLTKPAPPDVLARVAASATHASAPPVTP
jgi:signal transduction histidine kinase/ActR/RegA family two-component response regulator